MARSASVSRGDDEEVEELDTQGAMELAKAKQLAEVQEHSVSGRATDSTSGVSQRGLLIQQENGEL